MFTIGDFASHGRVSVRMLRHYDAVGLLRPARVDPATGYRLYHASQLARLNRVVALKDLGFTLAQVAEILDETLGPDELRGMLRLRRAELRERIVADAARLAQVEARLRTIELEWRMPTEEVQIKHIPPVRVAELTTTAASFEPESIGPVIQPLYAELGRRLFDAEVKIVGPAIAYYEDTAEGDILVHAALAVAIDHGAHEFDVIDLPAIDCAVTIVHRGSMDDVMPTVQALARWIETNGYRPAGYHREHQIEFHPGRPEEWVTELQEPITAS